jgi:hypothetical protein
LRESYPSIRRTSPTGATTRKNIKVKTILETTDPSKCEKPSQMTATYLKKRGIAIVNIRRIMAILIRLKSWLNTPMRRIIKTTPGPDPSIYLLRIFFSFLFKRPQGKNVIHCVSVSTLIYFFLVKM